LASFDPLDAVMMDISRSFTTAVTLLRE